MEICSDRRHDEVAYESRHCPVCTALDALDEVQEELNKVRKEADDLHDQLAE